MSLVLSILVVERRFSGGSKPSFCGKRRIVGGPKAPAEEKEVDKECAEASKENASVAAWK